MTNDLGSTRKTILLVDDSPRIRPLVREILKDLHWDILEADAGSQAIEIANGITGSIDLLVTDIAMPGMNGLELAEVLRERYPSMKVLCMSGYALPSAPNNDIHFIEKPFRPDALVRKVQALFDLQPAQAGSED